MIRLPTELEKTIRDGGTLVVPSPQRAYAAQLAHAAAQLQAERRVWTTPDILSSDAWLTREVERRVAADGRRIPRLLSANEDWLLWRQCAAQATGALDLVNRGALADALRRASSLAAEYGIDLRRFRDAPGTETALLIQVQDEVERRYRALDAAPLAAVLAELPGIGEDRPVRFAGFLAPSARQKAIISARSALGYESRFGRDDAGYGGAERQPLARGAARSVRSGATPEVVIAPDESAELERIAAWCKAQIDGNPRCRILVVLPGGAGPRERLATLIRQTVDPRGWLGPTDAGEAPAAAIEVGARHESLVMIEGGSPLARIPAVAHALSTLQWMGGEDAEFATLSEWLRAPFWKHPTAVARAQLDNELRDCGLMRPSLREWGMLLRGLRSPATIATAQQIGAQIEAAAAALDHVPASPRDWSQRFGEVLSSFGWPGGRRQNSADHQTIARFHELLDDFGQLAVAANSLSRTSAIQWFTDLAGHVNFRPADADGVVTISARLADPVVIYDAIWVAGLHSEALPQPVQPDPFLPLAAQLAAGVPAASAAGRLTEARQLLESWRRATHRLVLSAPARAEDLDLLPSPLLTHWITASAPVTQAAAQGELFPLIHAAPEPPGYQPPSARRTSPQPAGAQPSSTRASSAQLPGAQPSSAQPPGPQPHSAQPALWLALRMHREGLIESLDDFVGLPWTSDKPLPSGSRSLELQNLCPFRAYAELRLGSTALDAPEPGVAADVRGQILHVALQSFWQAVGDSSRLSALADSELHVLIDECVDSAVERVVPSAHSGRSPSLLRECRRTARLIRSLCQLELRRAPFRVSDTELDAAASLAGARLNLRIDRVDTLESGGRAILDYKSGQRASADWYGERPSHPQLLAYLAALGDDVVAMATVSVTAKEIRFDGVAHAPNLLPKVKCVRGPDGTQAADAWALRTHEWLNRVQNLAAAFTAGVATVDPKPGACEYCHVRSVCRIADQSIAEVDSEGSGGEAE